MGRQPQHRPPIAPLLMLLWLGGGLLALLVVFAVEATEYAYRQIGVSATAVFAVMFASLVGSAINIPVARLRAQPSEEERYVRVPWTGYRVPVRMPGEESILAVNVGGALIPTAMSVTLLIRDHIWWQAAAAVAIVTFVVHLIARPEPGVGITVPGFVPPLIAAASALALAPHRAAAVAYISGTLGTLIGADLLNLPKTRKLGGGVSSIGGAGTFDGVFLSGIVAVLIVALA
jgi:uncharacterized membrane protein